MVDRGREDGDPLVKVLQRTLANRAALATVPCDLADAARTRRRHRLALRTGLVGAAALGVAAAVALPVLMAGTAADEGRNDSLGIGPATGARTTSEPGVEDLAPLQPAEPGWRWETYGGVELQVPVGWRTGGTRQPWCVGGGPTSPPAPLVSRPGFRLDLGCPDEPPEWLFPYVEFTAASPSDRQVLVGDWVVETRQIGGLFVSVRTDDAAQAERILASARTVDEVDAVGCPVDALVTSPGEPRPTTGALDPAEVGSEGVVCQYLLGDHEQPLMASRRLTPNEVRAFADAVAAAPTGGGPDQPENCLPERERGSDAVLVRLATTDGIRDLFAWYSGCANGIDDGVTLRALTADVLAEVFGGAAAPRTYQASLGPLIE